MHIIKCSSCCNCQLILYKMVFFGLFLFCVWEIFICLCSYYPIFLSFPCLKKGKSLLFYSIVSCRTLKLNNDTKPQLYMLYMYVTVTVNSYFVTYCKPQRD